MKTILHTGFLIFIFCCVSYHASGLDFDFIIDGGIQTGTTQELVYEGGKLISRLNWNDGIVPVSGIAGKMGMYGVFIKMGMKFAIPVKSGTMEDYDFLISNSTEPSHYSQHDAYLDKGFSFCVEGGCEFRFLNWTVTPALGFQYRNRKWTAADGYLQYPLTGLWTGNETKTEVNGPVISYEQAVWFPFGALEIGYIYAGRHGKYRYAIGLSLCPYTWAETNDTHFLRSMQFYDTLRGGISWSAGCSVEFQPGNPGGIGFIIRSGYESLNTVKGNTASNNTGISSGLLTVDEGYSARMEIRQWYFSISVVIPVMGGC
jgi:plasminogen activator